MSSPEPAFGQRIRMLRKQAGLDVAELAKQSGIDSADLVALEQDLRNIKTSELSHIAASLGVSQLAIIEPESLPASLPIAARQHNQAGVNDLAVDRITALAELDWVLDDGTTRSQPKIAHAPQQESSLSWLSNAQALADWTIQQFRSAFDNYSTLPVLATAIETCLGVDVMVEDLDDVTPLGLSITDHRFPFILINANQPTHRALFTLAHELGHVLNGDGEIQIDNDLKPLTEVERSANAFAAIFLMPEARIKALIKKHERTAEALAHMLISFGVSYESLVYRLHNLRIINAHGRDQLKRIGWTGLISTLDDKNLARSLLSSRGSRSERRPPTLLASRCLRGVMNGTISAGPLARLLDVDIDHLIEKLKVHSEASQIINGDYSSPRESRQDALLAFDADPIAA